MALIVFCPSRGRPEAAAETLKSFLETRSDGDSELWFVVDSDDETRFDYPANHVWIADPPPGCMNAALGRAAFAPEFSNRSVYGFIGDDHRFRTPGWDRTLLAFAQEHPGIYYGNDLYQKEALPTNWFVTESIREQFGLGLSTLRHLFIDDYWKTLGEGAECLYYFPEMIIEHLHPAAGKAEWDESYRKVNSPDMYGHDGSAYHDWLNTMRDEDVRRLREIVA